MRISNTSNGTSLECDGLLFLLFRDNVQHYAEGGLPSERFRNLHALADHCWGAGPLVNARQLGHEIAEAWPLLRRVSSTNLAIGIRSRAALTGAQRPPTVRGTVLLRLSGWRVPVTMSRNLTLEHVFGAIIAAIVRFLDAAGDAELSAEFERSARNASATSRA